ncbi:hypothetical protein [Plantactinospora sp. KBS50]|uniref:hypothetical protein n=1 Tax=Plantactinospora sp. KBS50 TaxID=2024580 RepID=UPI000BAAB4B0|nr:hypothetical protein [Plantactinospora sp. KBS50]ASW54251.1 hypothetical protein CIK06_08720 [Plantactinospora sp. KBS50]
MSIEAGHQQASGPISFSPPDPYNVVAAADAFGGGAAPVLAGFAIALMGLAIDIHSNLHAPGLVILLFATSTVSLFHVVQVNAQARAYGVTPSQALEWYSDSDMPDRRQAVAEELRQHQQVWSRLVRRSRYSFNIGLVGFLIGGAVMAIPGRAADLGPGRIAAVAVLGLAAAIEIVAIVGDSRIARYRPLRWTWRVAGWASALPNAERERQRLTRDPC